MPCHHALYVGQTPGSPSPCLLHVLPPVAQPSAARHCRACPCPLVVLGQRSDPATTLGRAMLHIAKRAARRRPAARHCTDTAFPIQRTGDIRDAFLRYFEGKGHTVLPSSRLVPERDPTLLFTNAGMVQFKDAFLGVTKPEFDCAVTAQRCMRAGGKHNDLDNVGFTARHHTLFEMLGNFSFGAYFKEGAIQHAWTFLTEHLHLPPDRLHVTVHHDDKESAAIWRDVAGLPESRIRFLGDEDNFWSMGHGAGPCGPCSEVFYDLGPSLPDPEDRYLEIWNLVFMQYYRDESGALTDLPTPCVDTGMGLERVAAVLQGKVNNFDSDAFTPLLVAAEGAIRDAGSWDTAVPATDRLCALRIVADHARAAAALVADGVVPSNVGRGYVLRRIVRRALRHAHRLGARAPFLHALVPHVAGGMRGAFPELEERAAAVASVLENEERAFTAVLDRGLRELTLALDALPKAQPRLSADTAFFLYDTFGFPLDLTQQIAGERGVAVDTEGFEQLLEAQRASGRAAWTGSGGAASVVPPALCALAGSVRTRFTGYDTLHTPCRALSAVFEEEEGEEEGGGTWVLLDSSPFYAESGGQASDTGGLRCPLPGSAGHAWLPVTAVQQLSPGATAVRVRLPASADEAVAARAALRDGAPLEAVVCAETRSRVAAHHTATHLVHAVLRHVLGPSVVQAGSWVDATGLRFDFSHGHALSAAQRREVEQRVQAVARERLPVTVTEMAINEARSLGAQAHFDEKYGDRVRVVAVAPSAHVQALRPEGGAVPVPGGEASVELCGGTHAAHTGEVFPFKIVSEGSVAAGTRRVECVAGAACAEWLLAQHDLLERVASSLGGSPSQAVDRAAALRDQAAAGQKQVKALKKALAHAPGADPLRGAWHAGGVPVAVHAFPEAEGDPALAAQRAQALAASDPSAVHVVVGGTAAAVAKGKGGPAGACGDVLRAVLDRAGGKGGGKDGFAQGRLDTACDAAAVLRCLEERESGHVGKTG